MDQKFNETASQQQKLGEHIYLSIYGDIRYHIQVAYIQKWITYCTGLSIESLEDHELVKKFISVQ